MKKNLLTLGASAVILGTAIPQAANAFTVGIAMPTQEQDRWYKEGFKLERMLLSQGMNVELFYGGEFDVALQQKQVRRLANDNVDCMVIGSLDGAALTEALQDAKQKHIPVISYDRLITGTDAVSYYATFDNERVGQIQGQFIIDRLNPSVDNPKNIELFYGSLDDNNAKFFYKGAMKVLQPYINSKALVIKSKLYQPKDICVQSWSTDNAIKAMEERLEQNVYAVDGTKLDAVLSPADSISMGIITALKNKGYTSDNMPLITGQDANPDALDAIKKGELAMTVYKNSDDLCSSVVNMVGAISNHATPKINDKKTYYNGVKTMESYLCTPQLVTKDNLEDIF